MIDICESCGEPATTFDNPDDCVPLCDACKQSLQESEDAYGSEDSE